MKQFSIKTLFILTLVFAIVIVVIPFFRLKLAERKFHQSIKPIWSSAPYSSSLVSIKDTNDIVLKFSGNNLRLDSGGTLEEASNSFTNFYELNCTEGKFGILVEDDVYAALNSLGLGLTPYCLLRDALMLDRESPISTAPLWVVRGLLMPSGCEERLQHFETSQKMGSISGLLTGTAGTRMVLFDSTGNHSILVVRLDPKTDTWDRLADRLCLVEDAASGED